MWSRGTLRIERLHIVSTPMNGLEFALFGGFDARLDGRPLVNFRSAKTQALLLYLALTRPRPHRRDALAALLWPDQTDAIAKKNLRQALYRLGGLLDDPPSPDPPYLLVSRTSVALDPQRRVSVDVDTYRSLVAAGELDHAVALAHDELVPGFECGSEPFDDWLRSERDELRRSLLDALSTLTEERLFRGDDRAAAELARRQIELEPWREDAHRQLMRSLVLAGDRSGAIAQFETCRRTLSAELDIEPSPATMQLARRIRDNDLSQAHQPPEDPRDVTRPAPFVGRGDELAELGAAFERSGRGHLELAVLDGAAGLGKTALAERFLASVTLEGADVLHGRAFATRSGLPYQPLIGLLRPRIEAENAPDDLLSDVWLSQLSRLLPELRDRYPDLAAPSQDQTTAAQHLFEAIARLGTALAERTPVVVFVDDIHWADTASLDAIVFAAERWSSQNLPILVLVTVRPEALMASAPLTLWVDHFARITTTTRIDLRPLSALETEQLANAAMEDQPTAGAGSDLGRWLYARTGGHPLLASETLKALGPTIAADETTPGPTPTLHDLDEQALRDQVVPALRRVVEGWLARVSPPAKTVLIAAAVLAEDASLDRLRTLADLSEPEVAVAIDELVSAQLLREPTTDSSQFGFSHELVAELVADIAGPARLRLMHRVALDDLRAGGASAARLVRHALGAGSTNEAFELSVTAARDAMEDLAFGVAVEHFSTARRLADEHGRPPSSTTSDLPAVMLGLGRAFELTERWDEAEETYESLLAQAREAGLPSVERRALIRLAQAAYHTTDPERRERGTARLHQARAIATAVDDRRGLAEVDLELASIAYHGGDLAASQRLLEQVESTGADALDRRLTARQRTLRCLVHISHRRWPEAADAAAEAVDLYHDDQILAHDARRSAAYCVLQSGRPTEALELIEDALVFSQEIGNVWGETECLWKLGHTHLELGHYGLALDYARQGAAQAKTLGVPPLHELALVVLGTVQRTLFDLAGARATLVDDLAVVREEMGAASVSYDWAPSELCTISRLCGDWEQAAVYAAQRPGARVDEKILTSGLSAWDAIDAQLRSGEDRAARAELDRLETAAAGNDRYQLVLRRSQAVLATWEAETDAAIMRLRQALDLAHSLGLPGEVWPIIRSLAPALADRGDHAAAAELMRRGDGVVARLAATIEDTDVRQRFVGGAAGGAVAPH